MLLAAFVNVLYEKDELGKELPGIKEYNEKEKTLKGWKGQLLQDFK